jgi:hypothetical protein
VTANPSNEIQLTPTIFTPTAAPAASITTVPEVVTNRIGADAVPDAAGRTVPWKRPGITLTVSPAREASAAR